MLLAIALVSAWFSLTSVPSVAHVDWRCGTRGERLRVVMTPPLVTTDVVFRGRRRRYDGGTFTTPWVTGSTRVELRQFSEARTLRATLVVRFANLGYCEPYLAPPFTLTVTRT